jgi:multidrug efflux pump subunit AcrA (membrane-fusion protein)
MPPFRSPLHASLVALALALPACSGGDPPEAQLGAGAQAVTAAEQSQAPRFAPVELQTAREKLNAARNANREGDYERARRLAEQAQVDAELAVARARSASAEEAAKTVQQDIQALRDQPGTSGGVAPGTSVVPGRTVAPPRGAGSGSTTMTTPPSGMPPSSMPPSGATTPRSTF